MNLEERTNEQMTADMYIGLQYKHVLYCVIERCVFIQLEFNCKAKTILKVLQDLELYIQKYVDIYAHDLHMTFT